jgi:ligand-binding sensor domain-containing protein
MRPGVHYDDPSGFAVVFGYLFEIDGRGIEALFKVSTDKGLYYFAAQKGSVIMLDMDENTYQFHVEVFLDRHS